MFVQASCYRLHASSFLLIAIQRDSVHFRTDSDLVTGYVQAKVGKVLLPVKAYRAVTDTSGNMSQNAQPSLVGKGATKPYITLPHDLSYIIHDC
jgi:hypothetical protein